MKKKPELLGYYRLLLGFSQKQFYGRQYGFGRFKSMEEKGVLTQKNLDDLEAFCKAICASSALLLEAVPTLSREIVHELTLLTIGPQLRGGSLNTLGAEATQRIFDLIHEIVKLKVEKSDKKRIDIVNAEGRAVRIEFSSDPDICIRENLPSGSFRNLVAMEIKGGRDVSYLNGKMGDYHSYLGVSGVEDASAET